MSSENQSQSKETSQANEGSIVQEITVLKGKEYWDLKVEKGDIYRFHVLARLLTKSTVQLDFLLAKDICLVFEIELRLAGRI